jgi:hypothetical protein
MHFGKHLVRHEKVAGCAIDAHLARVQVLRRCEAGPLRQLEAAELAGEAGQGFCQA